MVPARPELSELGGSSLRCSDHCMSLPQIISFTIFSPNTVFCQVQMFMQKQGTFCLGESQSTESEQLPWKILLLFIMLIFISLFLNSCLSTHGRKKIMQIDVHSLVSHLENFSYPPPPIACLLHSLCTLQVGTLCVEHLCLTITEAQNGLG